ALIASTCAPRHTTTTATVGTSMALATVRNRIPSPGRRVSSSDRARANISAVDSAVQPLRSKITCTTATTKGTKVTISTAYQLRDPTRGMKVTTIALTSAADVTTQRTAMLLSGVWDSAC